ncbi:MAG: peptidase, partial [Haloarcula sp.]
MFGVPRRVVAVGLVVLLLGGGITPLPVAATPDHGPATGSGVETAAGGAGENGTSRADRASVQNRSTVETQPQTATVASNGSVVWIGSADTHRRQPRGQGGDAAGAAAGTAASMESEAAAGTAASREAGAATSGATQTDDSDVIRQTQTYARVPEEPGEVAVTLTYEIPDRVVDLETHVPAAATVT